MTPTQITLSSSFRDHYSETSSSHSLSRDLPPLWRSHNPDLAPKWLSSDGQRRVVMVAGLAVAVTSANLAQVFSRTPEYEGKFQISVEPAIANPAAANSTGSYQDAVPTIDYQTQIEILQSAALLTPVVEQLQAQDIELDNDLTSRLHIAQLEEPGVLEITYRDADPAIVQAVLEQVANAYLSYGQECQTDVCRGLEFVESQLPDAQQRVGNLRHQLQTLQQQHGFDDPSAEGRRLSAFSREIASQQATLQTTLPEMRTNQAILQQQIGLEPKQAIAETLLSESSQYQTLLNQLRVIESDIAQESTQPHIRTDKIQSLQQQHQQLQLQLRLEARQVAMDYLATRPVILVTDSVNLPVPPELTLRWIDTTQYIQALEIRQQALNQAKTRLTQQVEQWATLSRQYSQVKQELHTATAILNQYLTKRKDLEPRAARQKIAWEVVAPPELIQDQTGQPASIIPNLQRDLSSGIAFSLLVTLGAAIALDKRKSLNSAIQHREVAIARPDLQTRLALLAKYARSLESKQYTQSQILAACHHLLRLPDQRWMSNQALLETDYQRNWTSETPLFITAELVST